MRYALNLGADGRVLSATFEEYAVPGQPIVSELPEGNVNDYRFVDGEFVYDPLPVPSDCQVAEKSIQSGEYFSVGENLYVSTTKIPAGDPIKPGTNCIKTNLASVLNALNA